MSRASGSEDPSLAPRPLHQERATLPTDSSPEGSPSLSGPWEAFLQPLKLREELEAPGFPGHLSFERLGVHKCHVPKG